jgi:hypothetical protein
MTFIPLSLVAVYWITVRELTSGGVRLSPPSVLLDEVIPDIFDVTAGVALIIAGGSIWYGRGSISRVLGALMILLGVAVLVLNMLGII